MNKLFLKIFTAIIIMNAFLCAFSMDIEEYKEKCNIVGTEALLTEEKLQIQSDDGTVIIRLLNPYHYETAKNSLHSIAPYMRWRFTFPEPDMQLVTVMGDSVYFVLCEHETHILFVFDDHKGYMERHKDAIAFEKYQDFNNLSTYEFSYVSELFSGENITVLTWIYKKEQKYCGSIGCPAVEISTELYEQNKEYYFKVNDVYKGNCT